MSRARAMAMVVLLGSALAPFGCVGVVGDFDVESSDDAGSSHDVTTGGESAAPDAKGDTSQLPDARDEDGADTSSDGPGPIPDASHPDAADAADGADAACPDAGGLMTCGGRCVDTTSDSNNCGTCGVLCKDGRTCQSSKCQCALPTGECNGVCVDETQDPANCGSCGFTCAKLGSCTASRCICPADKSLACPAPPDPNAVCVDPNTDINNCGGCNNPCTNGQTCSGASCQCVAPLTQCPSGCTDMKTDPLNCGSCKHSCLGGACSGGLCTPVALAPAIAGNPVGLLVDATNVTWTQTNSTQSALMRCPIGGCGGTVLTMVGSLPDATTLATTPGRIFVTNNGGGGSNTVERVNVDGTGAVTWVSNGNGESVAADGVNVYWSHNGILSRSDGTLPAPLTAAQQIQVLTGFNPVGLAAVSHQQIVFDATNVYLLDPNGRVLSCGKTLNCAGSPTILLNGIDTPRGIWLTPAGQLYVTSSATNTNGGVFQCTVSNCAGTVKQIAQMGGVQGLFADASNVYWGVVNGSSSGVFSCPLTGCPTSGPVVVATGQQALSIATDASYVYWVALNGPAVWRVAK